MITLFLCSIVGCFFLSAVTSSFRHLRASRAQLILKELGKLFLYSKFQHLFFPKKEFYYFFSAALVTKYILYFLSSASGALILVNYTDLQFNPYLPSSHWILGWLLFLALGIFCLLILDVIPRIFASIYPKRALLVSAPIGSIYLFLSFPITYFFLKLPHPVLKAIATEPFRGTGEQVTENIIEMLEDAQITSNLDIHNRTLIESVLEFNDRIVREVMIPRVNVFAVPNTMTIRQAADYLLKEGYSRTPVYKDTIDTVIGILMYKDILGAFLKCAKMEKPESYLDSSIESLVKPVFYTPETKKVSSLLQEFRSKQIHLAIVVDEYGGTEGIVTIEDILEEIVGDISDEYDEEEEKQFFEQPSGGWIVDARMSILDIEENFDLNIPQDSDYDTIGGYIYHRAGSIPPKGFRIYHDDFELEVLSSNDRSIDKIRITPRHSLNDDDQEDTTHES